MLVFHIYCNINPYVLLGTFSVLLSVNLATTFSVFQQMERFLVKNHIFDTYLAKFFDIFQKLNNVDEFTSLSLCSG